MIGQYDAAVIDKENGKLHVVKRMDRPHIRVIPEWFGGGTLPRRELHEAAEQLTASQAGLIVVGEPTIEKGLDKALAQAARVVKRTVRLRPTKSPANARSAQELIVPALTTPLIDACPRADPRAPGGSLKARSLARRYSVAKCP